ncbi:MAG TPA: DUF2269 domain-containing protein [Xanthomonadaceae bacterium]|nr:DUF2269 domain-containing protein [Xanthomonadaceae bacterium]
MDYLVVKWVHILSSTLLFGTGLGIAFFMWMAHRRGDVRVIAGVARLVVIADAMFTAPTVLIQLVTGLWLMHRSGLSLQLHWLALALVLFVLVGACWLPVVWMQIRIRDLAMEAVARSSPLPQRYYTLMRAWFILGWPAFLGVLAIFWLMVVKPA